MLSHIKVLDLTDGLGAYTGRILAELGADVLRAESLGHDAFLDLVAGADILIRGRADAPLAHEALAQHNPRLIDVIVAPFHSSGHSSGESAHRPATDLTLMARSGLMAIVGDPDRAPLKLPGEQAYALAGIQGVTAALTALYARHASGKGQLVAISAFQSAVLANYREPVMWQWTGRIGKRTGNLLVRGKSGVRQVWPCRNGYVTWSFVDNPGMMRALVRVMKEHGGGEALADIDWDKTLVADVPREKLIEWERSVEAFFLLHSKEELSQWSVANGFGLSQIDGVEDVLASEQLRYRGLWRQVDDPASGRTLKVPGPLFVSSAAKENTP